MSARASEILEKIKELKAQQDTKKTQEAPHTTKYNTQYANQRDTTQDVGVILPLWSSITLTNYNSNSYYRLRNEPEFKLPRGKQVRGFTIEQWFDTLAELSQSVVDQYTDRMVGKSNVSGFDGINPYYQRLFTRWIFMNIEYLSKNQITQIDTMMSFNTTSGNGFSSNPVEIVSYMSYMSVEMKGEIDNMLTKWTEKFITLDTLQCEDSLQYRWLVLEPEQNDTIATKFYVDSENAKQDEVIEQLAEEIEIKNKVLNRLDLSIDNSIKYKNDTQIGDDDPSNNNNIPNKIYVDKKDNILWDKVEQVETDLNLAIANKQDKISNGLGISYNDVTKTINANLGTGLKQGANNTIEVDGAIAGVIDDYTIKNVGGKQTAQTIEFENNTMWSNVGNGNLKVGKYYVVVYENTVGGVFPYSTIVSKCFKYKSQSPDNSLYGLSVDFAFTDSSNTTTLFGVLGTTTLGQIDCGGIGIGPIGATITAVYEYQGTGTPVITSGGATITSGTPFTINGGEATGMMDLAYEIAFVETSPNSKVWVAQNLYNFVNNIKATQNSTTGRTDIELDDATVSTLAEVSNKVNTTDLTANYYNKTDSDNRYVQSSLLTTPYFQLVNGAWEVHQVLCGLDGGARTVYLTDELNAINTELDGKQDKINWLPKGTSTNNRTWTYTLVVGKKYRVGWNWTATASTTTLVYKEFVWNGTSIELERFWHSGVAGLLPNVLAINGTSSGITITVPVGTQTTAGYIGSLEELQ